MPKINVDFSITSTPKNSPTPLMKHYRKYLSTPKYKTGAPLDVEKIFSYADKGEIPLDLDAENTVLFFWSS